VRTDLDPETTVKKPENLPPIAFHIQDVGFVPLDNAPSRVVNAFLLRRLGDLQHLRVLYIHQGRAAQTLEGIGALKSLKTLVLGDISAGDESLQPLAPLTGLTTLVVDGDQITDSGLKSLAPLKDLTRLILNGRARRLHGSGFEALSGRTNLRKLELTGSGLDDEGARCVGRLTGLMELNLRDTWISRKGLEELAALKKLKTLNLGHCRRLQNEDFAVLGDFSALEQLDLSDCRITDLSFSKLAETLKKLTHLRTLILTATSAPELRRARPELEIKLRQPNAF
jgi:Leucine-rich repeat (LRR) protein